MMLFYFYWEYIAIYISWKYLTWNYGEPAVRQMFPDLVIKKAFIFGTFGVKVVKKLLSKFCLCLGLCYRTKCKSDHFCASFNRSVNCFVDHVLGKQYPCSRVAWTWSWIFPIRRRSHGGTGGCPPPPHSVKTTSERCLNLLVNVGEAHVSNITSNYYK
jgi:hypothetical protein